MNYGNIGILTDMDVDGNSIFCLLLKFFSRWENLFKENRIKRVLTPLYVCKKGNDKLYYYSQEEYENANLKGYQVDYIKLVPPRMLYMLSCKALAGLWERVM